jgi:DNA-binding CsgD family transcriptional regulator
MDVLQGAAYYMSGRVFLICYWYLTSPHGQWSGETIPFRPRPRITQLGDDNSALFLHAIEQSDTKPLGVQLEGTMSADDISLVEFQRLTTLMFAAAVDPQRWGSFLDALSQASGGVQPHVLGYDEVTRQSMVLDQSQYAPDFVASYQQHYGAINPWVAGFAEAGPGRVVTCEAMYPHEQLVRTEFHCDWLRPQGDISAGAGMILFKEKDRMIAIGGNIRRRDQDRLQERWMRLLTHLGPLLQHALEINRVLASQSLQAAAMGSVAAQGGQAVFLLADNGRTLFANAQGQALAEQGLLVRQDMQGRLGFVPIAAREQLRRALQALAQPAGQPAGQAGAHFVAVLQRTVFDCRTARFAPDVLHTPLPQSWLQPDQPLLLLTLTPRVQPTPPTQLLQQAWGLTPSEAEVASWLGRGLSISAIAEQRCVSLHTVRAQVKALLHKSGSRRQTELLHKLWAVQHDPLGG